MDIEQADALIQRLAQEAGLTDVDLGPWMTDYGYSENEIKRFAALLLGHVAQVCEARWGIDGTATAKEFAAIVRGALG